MVRIGIVLGALVAGGCTADPRDGTWEIRFADDALATRAARVIATVHRDACDGEVVYEGEVTGGAPRPQVLPPGTWAFAAVARDERCIEFAGACSIESLPKADGVVSLTLTSRPESAACAAPDCRLGDCPMPDAGFDAGPLRDSGGPRDAGDGDAGPPTPDGGRDAGPPMRDAGPPPRDAGPPDAGPPDAGRPDAGRPDAGPPDAGPPDAGSPTGCEDVDLGSAVGMAVHRGTTVGAGDDSNGSCGGRGSQDVVHRWVAPATRRYQFDNCDRRGGIVDSVMYVREGSCTGMQVGCNDDGCRLNSSVTVNVTAGRAYYIIIDALFGAGTYTLNITAR